MEFEYDPAKNERNIRDRGISFEDVRNFDFDSALIIEDTRQTYGETRRLALGCIGDRLHVLIFTERGTNRRIISLRKANSREVKRYEQAKTKS